VVNIKCQKCGNGNVRYLQHKPEKPPIGSGEQMREWQNWVRTDKRIKCKNCGVFEE